jgi:hypothetical protein
MDNQNDFSFLCPAPRTLRLQNVTLDVQNLCFPLEITKRYDFLFAHHAVKNKNRGLEIICQEKKTLAAEEYVLECEPGRVIAWSNSPRGRFYALSTLLQILAHFQPGGRMPGFFIRDAPALPVRGFTIDLAHGAIPLPAEMRRLLLRLAMLKFNCVALILGDLCRPGSGPGGDPPLGRIAREEVALVVDLGARMALDIVPAIEIGPVAPGPDELDGGILAAFDSKRVQVRLQAKKGDEPAASWFERFMAVYRLFAARGKKLLVWGGDFLENPDWIRKIPQDVMVLSEGGGNESRDGFKRRAAPFQKHHLPLVLATSAWSQARFIPAMRRSAGDHAAALAVVQEEKLAGIMLRGLTDAGDGSFLEGIFLTLFQAGNLFWSGRDPRPDAFSQWALGCRAPDLYRVYAFLSQVDSPWQHTHWQYLFEDPLAAACSRQDNVREVTAWYRKASLYLKKRKIPDSEVSDFLDLARHLVEFVADKVEFSSRLQPWFDSAGGDELIQRALDRLLPACEKLKDLYCQMWLRRRQPFGLARRIREFDFLLQRFALVQSALKHPGQRKKLAALLKKHSQVDDPPA